LCFFIDVTVARMSERLQCCADNAGHYFISVIIFIIIHCVVAIVYAIALLFDFIRYHSVA